MKIALVSLNIWELNFQPVTLPSLKLFARKDPLIRERTEIVIKNYPVNDAGALEDLYQEKPDLVGFSCYIWNYDRTLEVAYCLKQLLPGCVMVLGGPEVSYTPEECLRRNQAVDFVVRGEGEIPFARLVRALLSGEEGGLQAVKGIAYRDGDRVHLTEPGELVMNLEEIPSPYLEGEIRLSAGEDVMIEGSRGCPYRCNFCDFGKNNPLTRYFPIERVKQELEHVINAGVNVIGFTDAVFNMHKGRLREIFGLLARLRDRSPYKLFLEVYADLLAEADVDLFRNLGPVRMEVGLQTISPGAVKDMNRRQSLTKFRKSLLALEKLPNCHVSIDLIYGLPGDDYESFKDAIDYSFSFVGSQVRVYGLSILKGTDYYNHQQKYGLRYEAAPPYRVLSNYTFSYPDMVKVRRIGRLARYFTYYEDMVDLNQVVHHVCKGLGIRPSEMIEEFAGWLEDHDLDRHDLSADSILTIMTEFVEHLCRVKGHPALVAACREVVRYLCYLKRVGHHDAASSASREAAGVLATEAAFRSMRPRLIPGGLLRTFEFDPVRLLKTPGDRLAEVPAEPTALFFAREQGKVSTFRIAHGAAALLERCNGERTVGEIVESYLHEQVESAEREAVRRTLEKAFAAFFQRKVIAAA